MKTVVDRESSLFLLQPEQVSKWDTVANSIRSQAAV